MTIMQKLTVKNLRMNKTRTVVTILGIMLSAALMTVIACVAVSGQQTLINYAVQVSGDYDVKFSGDFSSEELKKIELNRNVQEVYALANVGIAKLESPVFEYCPYMSVVGINESGFERGFGCELKEGTYPKNSGEIVLTEAFLKRSSKNYRVGDKITLDVGKRYETGTDNEYKDWVGYMNGEEELRPVFHKTYTVSGILRNIAQDIDTNWGACVKVYTLLDMDNKAERADTNGKYSIDFCTKLTGYGARNYIQTFSEITGVSEDKIKRFDDNRSQENYDAVYTELEKSNEYKIDDFSFNYSMLYVKLIKADKMTWAVLTGVASVIFGIIVVSSIFIIRNSIAISVTEKTRLYGMLATTGATPRQIRKNVFFEGMILALFGIPSGVILGAGVTAILVWLANYILHDILAGINIAFKVSWTAILFSAVLGTLTIFLSTLTPALRASRIPPVEAIRSNRDIKVSKKNKEKSYKTPKLIRKFFGIGGSIAWKNLKRSKKQYRATVVSIIVSIAVYLTVFSFVSYAMAYSMRYLKTMDYNMFIESSLYDDEKTIESNINLFEQIKQTDEIDDYLYGFLVMGCNYDVPKDRISYDTPKDKSTKVFWYDNESFKNQDIIPNMPFYIYAYDDKSYKDLLKKSGYEYEEMKDKGLLVNLNQYIEWNEEENEWYITEGKYLKDPKGFVINSYLSIWWEEENNEPKPETPKIEIGGVIEDKELLKGYGQIGFSNNIEDNMYGAVIVSMDWFQEHIDGRLMLYPKMYIRSSDADKVESDINKANLEYLIIENYSQREREIKAMALIAQIAVYGFIGVISLIGLTNIFNTITNNMNLRKKEFAMLRSVGMTNFEFNRMITLESLFYTLKSLIIGIPTGLAGGYLVYRQFIKDEDANISYMFPWLAVLICIVAVALIVWLIMWFSLRKVRNQNIIETIRNENN